MTVIEPWETSMPKQLLSTKDDFDGLGWMSPTLSWYSCVYMCPDWLPCYDPYAPG